MMMPEAIERACQGAKCTWDELNMKVSALCKERDELNAKLKKCRNELCLKCGRYKDAYIGACDNCAWGKDND